MSDVCPLCFGSGIAVWVQDKVTKQFSPEPFRNSGLAWDYIHWCIQNVPGVRGVQLTGAQQELYAKYPILENFPAADWAWRVREQNFK